MTPSEAVRCHTPQIGNPVAVSPERAGAPRGRPTAAARPVGARAAPVTRTVTRRTVAWETYEARPVPRPSSHSRPRSTVRQVATLFGSALAVFLLALLLLTGLEAVLGHPVSSTAASGHTTLGDVLHPRS
jgi:hypothetical protein